MSFIFNQQQQQKRKSLHRHATHKPQQQPPPAARMQRRSSLVKDSSSPALLHVTGEPMKRKFSITACRRNSSFELPENQFMLTMNISNTETNEQIWYKQDGARFGGSQLTLKFGTNSLYNIYLKTKPAQNFTTLFIGNTELKLTAIEGGAGEFAAVWNTADKQPTKKGTRQDIEFVLTGKEKTLSKKLQIKFYPRTDSHAGWGQKLDQIIWQCAYNDVGNVTVTDEQTI